MRYDELTVDFRPLALGASEVTVSSSSYGGQVSTPFRLPFVGPALEDLMEELERGLRRWAAEDRDLVAHLGGEDRRDGLPLEVEKIGTALFESLLMGDAGQAFEKAVGHAEGRSATGQVVGLRLRLVFSPRDGDLAAHAALPWELLFRPQTRDFLARIPNGSVVRHIDVERPIHPIPVSPRLRVLLVDSAPVDYAQLDLPEERRRIREALERDSTIEVYRLESCDPGAMWTALQDLRCHVLHFMGHGGFDPRSGEGCLIFEGAGRRSQAVPARGLDDHLKGLPELGLVVLNACTAGALPRRHGLDPFKGVASAVTMAGIPATVAMQFPISDEAAIEFSGALYSSLAAGEDLDTAVGAGRRAILRQNYSSLEWATPVLYLRAAAGQIFEVHREADPIPAASRVVRQARALRKTRVPLHLGIRSMEGWGPTIEREGHRILDLTEHFEGRAIREAALWGEVVFPRLRDFLLDAASEGRALHLDFAVHWSLAFAAGYVLEAKSGLEVTVRQRTHGKPRDWSVEAGAMPEGPFWLDRPDRPGTGAPGGATHDVAVAIGVSRPVIDDVEYFLRARGIPTSRIIDATVHPEPGQGSVHSGAHALHLAHTLERLIRSRTIAERYGALLLFASAPNALAFFLGQLARPFGRIQLYEHDFGATEPAVYTPSLCLPVAGSNSD